MAEGVQSDTKEWIRGGVKVEKRQDMDVYGSK